MSDQKESHLFSLLEKINAIPLHRALGVEIRRYGHGKASAAMVVGPQNTGVDGIVGEGVLATLAGVATRFAIHTLIAEGRSIVPLEQQVRLLAPVKSGRLIAKARVERLRARLAQCQYRIYDEQGDLVANGHMLAYVLPREQIHHWEESDLLHTDPLFSTEETEETEEKDDSSRSETHLSLDTPDEIPESTEVADTEAAQEKNAKPIHATNPENPNPTPQKRPANIEEMEPEGATQADAPRPAPVDVFEDEKTMEYK